MAYWFDLLIQDFEFLKVFKELLLSQTAGWGFVFLYIAVLFYAYVKSRTPYVPLIISLVFVPFINDLLPLEIQKYAYVLTALVIAGLLGKIIYDFKMSSGSG